MDIVLLVMFCKVTSDKTSTKPHQAALVWTWSNLCNMSDSIPAKSPGAMSRTDVITKLGA